MTGCDRVLLIPAGTCNRGFMLCLKNNGGVEVLPRVRIIREVIMFHGINTDSVDTAI